MTSAPPSWLAVIPARGGSKGIPRKNVKLFLGKPLLAWTIETAKASGTFSRILISTDDQAIAQIATQHGAEAPFLRPATLAQDESPTDAAIAHAVRWLQEQGEPVPPAVMVLEPTSPGRRPWHVREAAALLAREDVDSVAGISETPHHYAAVKLLQRRDDGTILGIDGTPARRMIHRRQDLPVSYAFNSLIFACRTALLLQEPPTLWGDRVLGYLVDQKYNLDLDRPEDWELAEDRFRRLVQEDTAAAAKRAYANTLKARYGDVQAGLTKEHGTGWRCACEQDATLSCGPALVDCLERHGRLTTQGGAP